MVASIGSSIGYYPDAELVFGITCPLGVNYRPVLDSLKSYLDQFGYAYNEVKVSTTFDDLATQLHIEASQTDNTKLGTIWRKIELGNLIRGRTQKKDIFALVAAAEIESGREESPDPTPRKKFAHVIISLKRPEEVETLRRIYGIGFFLIGIAPAEQHRKTYFDELGVDPKIRTDLVETDANENLEYGQRTRDTFHLSDVFISLNQFSTQIARFLDLVFGCPFQTPFQDERAMYLAYAASLSSGDLARQVGAALIDPHGDCLSVGWNDVPKSSGGLYGPGVGIGHRDMDQGEDSNDKEKLAIAIKIIQQLVPTMSDDDAKLAARTKLKDTGFFDITEFGRAVHAEMEALLACARTWRSPRGATLYATTFPCHNCTRHIIASGVSKVFYIEPYAKSKAFVLHGDAIRDSEEGSADNRIPFVPFIGVGPRRYLDLFSLRLGTGYPIERKQDGIKTPWKRDTATPRLQMQPVSYLLRERVASGKLNEILSSSREDGAQK